MTASFVEAALGGHVSGRGVGMDAALFDGVGIITTGGLSVGAINFESQPHTKILMMVGRLEMIVLV